MARYAIAANTQVAQPAGMPVGLTVNGYLGSYISGGGSGFRLRRVMLGVRAGAAPPTSQQISVALHRQTTAPVGTGLTVAVKGQAFETWVPADPSTGIVVTTAATIGTTGPVLAANPLKVITFNTQNTIDFPLEFMEELIVSGGGSNGMGFVLMGNALPAAHFLTLGVEIEV